MNDGGPTGGAKHGDRTDGAASRLTRWHLAPTRLRVAGCTAIGLAASVLVRLATTSPAVQVVMLGWDAAAATFLLWTWLTIWPQDASTTHAMATRDDPSRGLVDGLLLAAAFGSLGAVGLVLIGAGGSNGKPELATVLLGVISVMVSWGLVHSVYCLKYASVYYAAGGHGIDFPGDQPPDYVDFGYLAFTIGMTYQVSDTTLNSRAVRRTAFSQGLVAFVFGTGILAITINLVAGLTR